MDTLSASLEQVYKSDAHGIRLRFEILGINFFAFRRNYEELKGFLEKVQNPEMASDLWNRDERRRLRLILHELMRLLHNFVASAKSLIDHTRNLTEDWYSEVGFLEEYKLEVEKRFLENPVVGFVEGLRNYALHYRLPVTVARLTFGTDPETQELVPNTAFALKKSELAMWSKWPSKARVYLNATDEDIIIEEITDLYFQEVQRFHKWLEARLREIHAEELAWLEEMLNEIRNAE